MSLASFIGCTRGVRQALGIIWYIPFIGCTVVAASAATKLPLLASRFELMLSTIMSCIEIRQCNHIVLVTSVTIFFVRWRGTLLFFP